MPLLYLQLILTVSKRPKSSTDNFVILAFHTILYREVSSLIVLLYQMDAVFIDFS